MTRVFAHEKGRLYTGSCCHFNAQRYNILTHAMGRAIAEDLRIKLRTARR